MNPKKNNSNSPRANPLLLQERLARVTPLFQSFYIKEPKLVFGDGKLSVDPKAGLEAYGPFGWENQPGKTIQIGLIGTGEGIQEFLNFLSTARSPILAGFNKRNKPLDPHTHPDFPGCNPNQSFRSNFVSNNTAFHRSIHPDFFARALKSSSEETRMRDVVALVVRELQALENLDPGPDVVVVMLPRDVEFELAHVGAAMARRRTVLSPKDRFLTKLRKDEAKGQGFPHR